MARNDKKQKGISIIPLKKQKAKRLYVNQLYTAKQTSIEVGVNEKTVGKWIKDNDWKLAREQALNEGLKSSNKLLPSQYLIINDLRAYIEENSPMLAKKINPLIDNYLNLIS